MMSVGLALEPVGDAHAAAGLVGPNAVLQLAAALRASRDPGAAERVFARAGFSRLLQRPPDAMIDETIPARLFEALWREAPPDEAADIARDAGRRTGAYVLANRIPAFARLLLRALPARLAAPLLLKAIRKNAWTFAGSGACEVASGPPAVVTIAMNPLAMPGCVWHVGVLETLFRGLIREDARVSHHDNGARVDRFEIDLRGASGRQELS